MPILWNFKLIKLGFIIYLPKLKVQQLKIYNKIVDFIINFTSNNKY